MLCADQQDGSHERRRSSKGAERTKRSKKKKKKTMDECMEGLVDEKEEQHHYGWMDITEIPNRYQPPSLFCLLAKFR
jgi:hypothetical protein